MFGCDTVMAKERDVSLRRLYAAMEQALQRALVAEQNQRVATEQQLQAVIATERDRRNRVEQELQHLEDFYDIKQNRISCLQDFVDLTLAIADDTRRFFEEYKQASEARRRYADNIIMICIFIYLFVDVFIYVHSIMWHFATHACSLYRCSGT